MASDQFVSRAGEKLQSALDQFKIDVKGKIVLDVGSSTGGFVDCLLQNGAKRVYALDTSYGELAWKLRNDKRVVVMERTNILYLDEKASLELNQGVDLITIDAGWTKLGLILPKIIKFLKKTRVIIALLKPQYEIEKNLLQQGIVPEQQLDQVKDRVVNQIDNLTDLKVLKVIKSPITGKGGNQEYLLLITSS